MTKPSRKTDMAEELWSQIQATDWSFKEYTKTKANKISTLTHLYYRMPQMTQWYTVNDGIL